MTVREKVLYHEIHPFMLLTDWSMGSLSCYLLWQHRLRAGLLAQVAPLLLPLATRD